MLMTELAVWQDLHAREHFQARNPTVKKYCDRKLWTKNERLHFKCNTWERCVNPDCSLDTGKGPGVCNLQHLCSRCNWAGHAMCLGGEPPDEQCRYCLQGKKLYRRIPTPRSANFMRCLNPTQPI